MQDFCYEHKKVKVLGKKIQVYTFGKGKNIVVAFPCFPHSGLSYRWLFSEHDLTKIKVITFDVSGWIGESENLQKEEMFSLDYVADLVRCLLDELKVRKFSVMGYSFGGAVALKVASELIGNVEKIVFISAVVAPLSCENMHPVSDINFMRRWNLKFLLKNVIVRDYYKWRKELSANGLPEKFLSLYDRLVERSDNRVMAESVYTLFHTDLSGYLERIKDIPTLVINSHDEEKLFHEQAEIIRRKLSGEKSVVVHGEHVDFLLRPNHNVVDKIVDFLSED
jgi:pimeloyl-ACP methyl ester carboxylesterase